MAVACAENDYLEALLLHNIEKKSHLVFTNDLFSCLCWESGIHCTTAYIADIHPNSPLTKDIQTVIVQFYKNHREYFKEQYRRDVAKKFSREIIYKKFRQSVEDFLSKLFCFDVAADEVLRRVVNAAMMSIDFYNYGFNDALKFCKNCMSAALEECNKRHNFRMFDLIAKEASDIVQADCVI